MFVELLVLNPLSPPSVVATSIALQDKIQRIARDCCLLNQKAGRARKFLVMTIKKKCFKCKKYHTIEAEGKTLVELEAIFEQEFKNCKGRKCYGMELDPKYIDVIIERWENYTGDEAIKVNE